jgi:hypothetical protein
MYKESVNYSYDMGAAHQAHTPTYDMGAAHAHHHARNSRASAARAIILATASHTRFFDFCPPRICRRRAGGRHGLAGERVTRRSSLLTSHKPRLQAAPAGALPRYDGYAFVGPSMQPFLALVVCLFPHSMPTHSSCRFTRHQALLLRDPHASVAGVCSSLAYRHDP